MEDSLHSNFFQNSSIHDNEFCTIFFKAAKKLFDFEKERNAEELNRYYGNFHKYFNIYFGIRVNPGHPDYDSETVKSLKDSLYYRIIYVLRNSPIFSSAVAFHFQNVLKEDFSYLRKLIKKEKIKICSIGGGAVSDVVAVVKILDSVAIKMDKQLDFRITVIDSDANWKNTCFTVLSCLKNFDDAASKINFVQADISDKNSYSAEVIKSIQEADVVLMVMLLYDFKNANTDAKETVKNICELMQCGSMLFLLDLDLIEYIKSCFGLSGETNNCHLVYENLSDFHFLDMEANYNSYIRYKKHFAYLHCTKYVGVFVRAWIKTSTREISGIRNELQHRFKKEVENCDPEQTFFCHDFFESWLVKYANMKRKAGMSEGSINELLQEKRKKRIFFRDKLTEDEEKLETARKELIGENVQLEEGKHHGADEIDEEAWEKYIIQKKEYSHVKKYAYENLMFDKEIPDFLKNSQ